MLSICVICCTLFLMGEDGKQDTVRYLISYAPYSCCNYLQIGPFYIAPPPFLFLITKKIVASFSEEER